MAEPMAYPPVAPVRARARGPEEPAPRGKLYPSIALLFLTRYPILTGLLLAGLAPVALYVNPDLLRNLLVLDWPVHVFNVSWMSFLVATLVLVSWRVIQVNAGARFGVTPYGWLEPRNQWKVRWLLWLALGSVVPAFCVWQTSLDPWRAGWDGWGCRSGSSARSWPWRGWPSPCWSWCC